MSGRKRETATELASRFCGDNGTKPLSQNINPENYFKTDGSLGAFLVFRHLIENVEITIEELTAIPELAQKSNFFKRGAGKLKPENAQTLIHYLNSEKKSQLFTEVPKNIFNLEFPNFNALDAYIKGEFDINEYKKSTAILPSPKNFIPSAERQKIINRLQDFILSERQFFLLRGDQGRGKSVLLSEFVHNHFPAQGRKHLCVDCRANPTFLSILVSLYQQLFGTADFVQSGISSEAEIMGQLREKIGQHPTLLILDNAESLAINEHVDYQAIRSDNILDFASEVCGSSNDVKIIFSVNGIPPNLDLLFQFESLRDSCVVPPLSVQELTRITKRYEPYNHGDVLFEKLISLLENDDIPGSLLNCAKITLRMNPSEKTILKLKVRMIRRSYRGIVRELVESLSFNHSIILKLIALSEDGLKISSLKKLDKELDTNFSSDLDSFRKLMSPLSWEIIEENEPKLDLDWKIRQSILEVWESPIRSYSDDESPDQALKAIIFKRDCHYEIGILALRSAMNADDVYSGVRFLKEKEKRLIQCITHLLASIDPRKVSYKKGLRFPRGKSKIEFYIKLLEEGRLSFTERFNLALELWQHGLDQGFPNEGLSALTGADALQLAILAKFFHLGILFPRSDNPHNFLRTVQNPAYSLQKFGQSKAPRLQQIVLKILHATCIKSLRLAKFSLAHDSIEIGKSIILSQGSDKFNTEYHDMCKTHIDLLIQQGALLHAEELAISTSQKYMQLIAGRIQKYKNILSNKKSGERVRSLNGYNSIHTMLISLRTIKFRLAKILFLQGRLIAASREVQYAVKLFEKIGSIYEIDFSPYEKSSKYLVNPIQSLRGFESSLLMQLAIRLHAQDRLEQKLDPENSNPEHSLAVHIDFDWFRIKSEELFGVLPRTLAGSLETPSDKLIANVNSCTWIRYTRQLKHVFSNNRLKLKTREFSNDLLNHSWAGSISPVQKMTVLHERAQLLWMLYNIEKQENITLISLREIFDILLRIRWQSEKLKMPLRSIDTNLLLAEILLTTRKENIGIGCELNSHTLIEEACDLIEKTGYDLRWREVKLLQNFDKYKIKPSHSLIV